MTERKFPPKNSRLIETMRRRGCRIIAPLSASTNDAEPVLVGRDGTLQMLRACLRKTLCGRQQYVFLSGEAGIGKTAVIDEFHHQVTPLTGLRIARGQCIEGCAGKEPYYPLMDALGQLLQSKEHGELGRILAAHAPSWSVQFPAALTRQHREQMPSEPREDTGAKTQREISDALAMLAAARPLLLVLEDLQWADDATVGLISAVARRRTPTQLMLLGTYRTADLTGGHPLVTVISDARIHNLCQEIALTPLAESDVAAYLKGTSSDGDSPQELARLLHSQSEGNPLFMVTAMEHLTRRGLLSKENGRWHMAASPREILDVTAHAAWLSISDYPMSPS